MSKRVPRVPAGATPAFDKSCCSSDMSYNKTSKRVFRDCSVSRQSQHVENRKFKIQVQLLNSAVCYSFCITPPIYCLSMYCSDYLFFHGYLGLSAPSCREIVFVGAIPALDHSFVGPHVRIL